MIDKRTLTILGIIALAGCSSDSTPSDAMKAVIENCSVPVSMEVRVSSLGTEFGVRCDAMKRPMEALQ